MSTDPVAASLVDRPADHVPGWTWTASPCPVEGLVTGSEVAASLPFVVHLWLRDEEAGTGPVQSHVTAPDG